MAQIGPGGGGGGGGGVAGRGTAIVPRSFSGLLGGAASSSAGCAVASSHNSAPSFNVSSTLTAEDWRACASSAVASA